MYQFVQTVAEKPQQKYNYIGPKTRKKTERGPMPNVMAAQPNIGGALRESSVISFLVTRRKFWLTPAARMPRSNVANTRERNTWAQSEVCILAKISSGGKNPRKCIYSVPVQETAKHRVGLRFGWPPVSDVPSVTKPRRETR